MPTYVVLYTFTEQGLKGIKDTVHRASDVRADLEKRGFKVPGIYWTQGRYDLVAIIEAPDENAMLKGSVNVAGAGNVKSETLRAFTESEMKKALA